MNTPPPQLLKLADQYRRASNRYKRLHKKLRQELEAAFPVGTILEVRLRKHYWKLKVWTTPNPETNGIMCYDTKTSKLFEIYVDEPGQTIQIIDKP